jgi:hypothetical protein
MIRTDPDPELRESPAAPDPDFSDVCHFHAVHVILVPTGTNGMDCRRGLFCSGSGLKNDKEVRPAPRANKNTVRGLTAGSITEKDYYTYDRDL